MSRTRIALLALTLLASACHSPPAAPADPDAKPTAATAPEARTATARSADAGDAHKPAAKAPRDPATLFHMVGCFQCHAPGAPFHQKLLDARDKPDAVVASWIMDPQKVKPGTQMPSFAKLMSQTEALSLARWIKAGNPK